MIARDRELLARLAQVNVHLGDVVVELMIHQDGGELPAEGLRQLAEVLGGITADLYARAAELDARMIAPQRVIIDARPTGQP
ncbi:MULTISPECIES: hypothetical protein [Prauserella]|uniref:Uncharacterized protein n=2 Tax=Prauserella TaxID=142577 RepID=A0A318L8W9_9PSEU|nr:MULTISPECIES: hypothetical protein [Prauserella]PXY16674.1 hypothetical protein BAY59_38275 [Prauserella coralliicola]PXY16875.1 hypothetical protein BA062_38255 [Prauserella flavalba]TKG58262.1 hypothetical protein FCN18_38265 [Prauserella endophytica]